MRVFFVHFLLTKGRYPVEVSQAPCYRLLFHSDVILFYIVVFLKYLVLDEQVEFREL